MNSIKTASILYFEKKMCTSDGLMYAGSWKNKNEESAWKPVRLQHKDLRGTISNRLKSSLTNDPLKLDAEIQKANLQSVDVAALPFDTDTLKLVFTLRVLGNLSVPAACNNQEYQSKIKERIGAYLKEQQCLELSLRYAENLANARFLWRNRICADEIEVKVSLLEGNVEKKSWPFDSQRFCLRKFSTSDDQQLAQLAETIRIGLIGESYVFLKIEAFARIGAGQEVFPSQELVRESGNEKYKKSKVLYSVGEIAAMHSQKIGNAIRTIDTWYPNSEDIGPISVEPYGSVTNRGVAYRQPKDKMDFYSLLDGWMIKDTIPSLEQQHFVIACLVRGGVFGEKEKD